MERMKTINDFKIGDHVMCMSFGKPEKRVVIGISEETNQVKLGYFTEPGSSYSTPDQIADMETRALAYKNEEIRIGFNKQIKKIPEWFLDANTDCMGNFFSDADSGL